MMIVAAGSSSRMGQPKQQIPLHGAPVLLHTLRVMQSVEAIDELLLVTRPEDIVSFRAMAEAANIEKLRTIVAGGASRQQSVCCGLAALPPQTTLLGIHDGARPLVSPAVVEATIAKAAATGAAAAAIPVKDTLKRAENTGRIIDTADRQGLWRVQTPQVFALAPYRAAMEDAVAAGEDFTDDCQLMEKTGYPVYLVPGEETNLKLTTPEDVGLAEAILASRFKEEKAMRIGHGYDVHRLVEDRALILGGVNIPWDKGLLGHSDADVLTHAVMDALLGAAGLGDIGKLFPDTDPAYAGADSLKLLQTVVTRLAEKGWRIGNIDATVLAQQPKLAPHIPAMVANLATACGITDAQVNVKATTEEKLGFTGSGEGIAAHSVCLLLPR